MSEREQIVREVRELMTQEWKARFKEEQNMKLNQFRQQNRYIRKDRIGSPICRRITGKFAKSSGISFRRPSFI